MGEKLVWNGVLVSVQPRIRMRKPLPSRGGMKTANRKVKRRSSLAEDVRNYVRAEGDEETGAEGAAEPDGVNGDIVR